MRGAGKRTFLSKDQQLQKVGKSTRLWGRETTWNTGRREAGVRTGWSGQLNNRATCLKIGKGRAVKRSTPELYPPNR